MSYKERAMQPVTLTVESRIVGGSADTALSPVVLEILNEILTVRELIERTVEEQIRDLVAIRRLDVGQAERALNRQYLTTSEVRQQAQDRGVVKLPSQVKQVPEINVRAEIKKAISGFEAGSFIIFVDGSQMETLDDEIQLGLSSKVTFLRLTPLVGG
jgi:hypothetical protein